MILMFINKKFQKIKVKLSLCLIHADVWMVQV
jgi:hypothetical protein